MIGRTSLFSLWFFPLFLFAKDCLSFLIPCYNCAPWIEQTLSSIYEQRLPITFEVICIDDASTDPTWRVLQSCKRRYPRLTLLQHDWHRGDGAARNTGAHKSRGNVLLFLEGGDVLETGVVSKLLQTQNSSGADLVFFEEIVYFSEGGGILKTRFPSSHQSPLKHLLQSADHPAWRGCYLLTKKGIKKVFFGYPEECFRAASFGFVLTLLERGALTACSPDTTYWCRKEPEDPWELECRNNRLPIGVLRTLYKHREILSQESLFALEQEIDKTFRKQNHPDPTWLIREGLLSLRE